MAATDLTQYQLERLAFIRYLFKLGIQHAQDPGPQSSVAILLFHDAVELFLELASQTLHAKPAEHFMKYFSQLDEKLHPGILKSSLNHKETQILFSTGVRRVQLPVEKWKRRTMAHLEGGRACS